MRCECSFFQDHIIQLKLSLKVEFRNIAPTIERDIFQRVQMGVTLTAAGGNFLIQHIERCSRIQSEKLAAISTPYADWITDLDAKHIQSEDGLAFAIPWDSRRGKHFQCLAQIIFAIERLPARSDISTAKIGAWLQRQDPPGQQFKQKIEDVLYNYWRIATTVGLSKPFKSISQVVSPVEFVFIGVSPFYW